MATITLGRPQGGTARCGGGRCPSWSSGSAGTRHPAWAVDPEGVAHTAAGPPTASSAISLGVRTLRSPPEGCLMHTARLAGLRRRQPLLRGARRVHPAPRSARSGPGSSSGSRSAGAATTRWAGADQPGRHQPDLRPGRRPPARCVDFFRGNPNGRPMHELHGQARADPPRVPGPRRPAGRHGRPGPGQDLALPDARHALRGGAQARPRRRGAVLPGLQPLAGRGLGHGLSRTASSPPPTSRWPTWTRRCRAGVGARPGRPLDRHAGGGATTVDRAVLTGRRAGSTPSGPWSTRRASPWSCTPATPGCRRTATPPMGSRPPSSAGAASGRASRCSPSSGRPTTSWPPSCSRSSSTASPTSGWPRWRTGRSSWPRSSASSAGTTARCRGISARIRSSPSGATCGSTRSGRTTSTRSSTSWATTGSSSARTGPTSRACPSPRTG